MPLDPARPAAGGRLSVKLHRRVCLVQTEDALLAEELLARKKLAQDIVGRLTDRALLIRPGRVEAVLAELQKMGIAPQDAKDRVDAMNDQEVIQLAGRLDQAVAGGQVGDRTLLLILLIILLILII